MATGSTTKAARRAAREAALAAQEELARRARANTDDLTVFFSARHRAEAVEVWLAERLAALRAQADARRGEQQRQCGVALRAMRDRGQSVREIAAMAGVAEKVVRDLIRGADAVPPPAGADGSSAADVVVAEAAAQAPCADVR